MLYKAMQNLVQEYHDVLKHVNVRWLSLERARETILLQYTSLKSYFESQDVPKSISNANDVEPEWEVVRRFKRLKKPFDDRMTDVHLYFFGGVLPIFEQTNFLLQREDGTQPT